MATVPVGGIKRFTVEGNALDVADDPDFSVTTFKNETVPVIAGTPGTKVVMAIPYIEITVSTRGIRVADYVGQRGVTAQIDLQNGRSYVWPSAAEVGDGKVAASDGKLTLRYESADAKEL
jgi:hypothetical protein